jgi:hypothetical protein
MKWTVLLVGNRFGFIQDNLTWGGSTPEKATKFDSLAEAMTAATALHSKHPDICQVRFIREDFNR